MVYIHPYFSSYEWFVFARGIFRVVLVGIVLAILSGCGPSRRAGIGYHPTLEKELAALQESSQNTPYVVNAGDTLWSIAKQFGTTISGIIDVNGIGKAATLKVGQILKIPIGGDRAGWNAAIGSSRGWIWPVRGDVTTAFGQTKGRLKSSGIDIRAKAKAEIVAVGNGVVRKAGPFMGLGKTVVIQHDTAGKIITLCGGIGELIVSSGEHVRKGQTIGFAPSIIRNKSVIHFRMFRKGVPVNPREYLP